MTLLYDVSSLPFRLCVSNSLLWGICVHIRYHTYGLEMRRWLTCVWMLLDASSFHSVSLLFPSSPLFQQSDGTCPVNVDFTFTLILIRLVPGDGDWPVCSLSVVERRIKLLENEKQQRRYCTVLYPYPSSHDWWVVVMSHTLAHSSLPLFGIWHVKFVNVLHKPCTMHEKYHPYDTVPYAPSIHPSQPAGVTSCFHSRSIFFFRDDIRIDWHGRMSTVRRI